MIDPTHPVISIARQCELIHLPRASYYRAADCGPVVETEENLNLMRLIDEEYTRHPFYGSRQLRNYLRRQGHKIYPYLLKNLVIDKPNQVWCTDITYLRLHGGFVYLVAVMDWHSRKVLSWEISNTMDDSFCVSALERAIRLYGVPEIFNTDQGAQFTGNAFIKVLTENGIGISMDGKGRWVDNVLIERLWRSVKYEDVYLKEYSTVVALRHGIGVYFHFYNNERPHDSLGKCTPSEYYDGLREAA